MRQSPLVWIEGRLTPARRARVPATEHALLYGDSIYETLRTDGGKLMFLDRHLKRLARSAHLLGISLPHGVECVEAIAASARRRLHAREVSLRIMVTRGVGPLRPDPTEAGPPRLLVFIQPWKSRPRAHYSEGVSAKISRYRRASARSIPSEAKTGNYLPHVLATGDARRAGADEALMLSLGGLLAEGATSNLFFWKRRTLFTPHARTGLLPGITRRVVLDLARGAGYRTRQVIARPRRLMSADEAFLTNSTGGIIPLVRVNERPIGAGRPGPLTQDLMRLYALRLERERHASGAVPGRATSAV